MNMQEAKTIIEIALIVLCVILGVALSEFAYRERRFNGGRDTRSSDYRRARREEKRFRKKLKEEAKHLESLQSSEPTNTN